MTEPPSWAGFVLHNLIPVTLGNLVGGAVLVAAVYWCAYLRGTPGHQVVWTRHHRTHAPEEAGRTTHDHVALVWKRHGASVDEEGSSHGHPSPLGAHGLL